MMMNMEPLTETEMALKKKIHDLHSRDDGKVNNLTHRKLIMNCGHRDDSNRVQKVTLGNTSNHRSTKVILMIGATGAGKTTLINAMVNFIFKVEFDDTFRFILLDEKTETKQSVAQSQTDMITAYEFNYMPGMPFEYNYILIDTPGFGDTRGIQRDRELMHQLELFLKQDYGADQVDGVGFVTAAANSRLTPTQKYVFDGLLSMFGKNITENIYIMATFADNCEPPVLAALNDAKFPYKTVYKFNNSAIFAPNDDRDMFSRLYWQVGYKNIRSFFSELQLTAPVSLQLTQEVLDERIKLQEIVRGLDNQVQIGLSKLNNLHSERDMLVKVSNDVECSKDYEVEVDIPKVDKVKQPGKKKGLKDNFFGVSANIFGLFEIKLPIGGGLFGGLLGNALQGSENEEDNFSYETTMVKEKRTVQALLDKHNVALKGKESIESTITKIETEIKDFGNFMVSVVKSAKTHIQKLEAIALKPNPLSAMDYIDLMIETEKMDKGHDYEKRINMLEMLKKQESILAGVRGAVDVADEGGEKMLEVFKNMTIKK